MRHWALAPRLVHHREIDTDPYEPIGVLFMALVLYTTR